MGVPYAAQLGSKQERCVAALADFVSEATWLEPFRAPESAFRNKAKLVVGGSAGAVTLGILDAQAHGVDLRHCGLYEPGLAEAIPELAGFLDGLAIEPYDVRGRRGELKHVIVTHSPDDELMVRFVLRSRHEVARIRKHLPRLLSALPSIAVVSVNLQPVHMAILEGEAEIVLTERPVLPMRINDVLLQLRPNSFFQTNTAVAAALYRQARRWVESLSPSSLWDLYCGAGGFALHCVAGTGRPREVLGIETSPDAIESARDSASLLTAHDGSSIEFVVGDATTVGSFGRSAPDLVIVNPPRRGLGPDLAGWLDSSTAEHVIYSSCNVDSLAKDLGVMGSYSVQAARLFDMFPQTNHHEVMVLLTKDS